MPGKRRAENAITVRTPTHAASALDWNPGPGKRMHIPTPRQFRGEEGGMPGAKNLSPCDMIFLLNKIHAVMDFRLALDIALIFNQRLHQFSPQSCNSFRTLRLHSLRADFSMRRSVAGF